MEWKAIGPPGLNDPKGPLRIQRISASGSCRNAFRLGSCKSFGEAHDLPRAAGAVHEPAVDSE